MLPQSSFSLTILEFYRNSAIYSITKSFVNISLTSTNFDFQIWKILIEVAKKLEIEVIYLAEAFPGASINWDEMQNYVLP